MRTGRPKSNTCARGHVNPERYKNGCCKQCQKINGAVWNRKNRVRAAENNAKRRERNRERYRLYNREWKVKNPEYRWRRRGVVGVIPPKPADGLCECCRKTPTVMCMDHNHKTGLFRGWLCNGCNTGIGHAQESIDTLLSMAAYLERKNDRRKTA